MKYKWIVVVAVFLAIGVGAGYIIQESSKTDAPPAQPLPFENGMRSTHGTASDFVSGIVMETTNSGGYTYVRIESDNQAIWAASSAQKITVGQPVTFSTAMPMRDFHSPSLNRTFDTIYFASTLNGDKSETPTLPAGHPPLQSQDAAPHGNMTANAAGGEVVRGQVLETMDAGTYTYVKVAQDGKDAPFWAASPKVIVKEGQRIEFEEGQIMPTFSSPTLNQTFTNIHFVSEIRPEQSTPLTSASGPSPSLKPADRAAAPEGEVVAIAELLNNKAAWQGMDILVRGKVVKATPNVMGKTWVHIVDAADNKVVCTTLTTVGLGETIIVNGRVTLDSDIGAGYVFDVLLEDCKIFSAE